MYRARAHTSNRTSEIPHDTQFQKQIANDCSMNRSKKLLPSPAYLQYGSPYSDAKMRRSLYFCTPVSNIATGINIYNYYTENRSSLVF